MFSSAEACTPLITYNELEKATNYWNKDNILGKGGFGVVFKGIWRSTAVAVKRLEAQVIIQLNISFKIECFINTRMHIFRKEQNNNLIF